MFGRLTAFLLVSVLAFGSAGADEGDYLMGLNAYKDGLNSVAKMGFEAYLADSPDQANKHYAEYLMYRILLEDGDTDGAYSYFAKIESVADSRFDQNVIKGDKMRFLIRRDCAEARKELISGTSAAGAAVYTESSCPMDSAAARAVASASNDSKVLLAAAGKSQATRKPLRLCSQALTPKTLPPSRQNISEFSSIKTATMTISGRFTEFIRMRTWLISLWTGSGISRTTNHI